MSEILQKCAEILAYNMSVPNIRYRSKGELYDEKYDDTDAIFILDEHGNHPIQYEIVDPFADTIEGRRHADAIEDYLYSTVALRLLWNRANMAMGFNYTDHHQWRLDRIKWCIGELVK